MHKSKGFGLFTAALPSMNDLSDLGIASGAGLAAVLGFEGGVERIPQIPYGARKWMPLVEVAAGAILGPLAANYYPKAGLGIGIALAVGGAKRLLAGFEPTANLIPGGAYAPASASSGTAGYETTDTDAVLLGESSVDTEDIETGFGDSPVEVEDVDSTFGNASYY